MTCNIIATGSKGNAILLNGAYLLDCGVPFSKLKNVYKDIQVVFLSHQHLDHINPKTVLRIHKERPAVRFACGPWMSELLREIGIADNRIDVFWLGELYGYGSSVLAKCVEIPHDVPNCAWDLELDGETVFYATDCGDLFGIEAKDRDLYLIEGNYKEDDLVVRMEEKAARGQFSYEARVARTHLSVEQAMRFLAENAGAKSKYVLIHRHQD